MASWGAGRRSLFFLVAGVCLLALGIGISVVRHDRDVDRTTRATKAAIARNHALLRRVNATAPDFEVAYVQVGLGLVASMRRAGYKIADTPVARRITMQKPSLDPDLSKLPYNNTNRFTAGESRVFREHLVRQTNVFVVGLIVTQTTPGSGSRLHLIVQRLPLPHGYEDILDPTELVPGNFESAFPRRGRPQISEIVWSPRLDRKTFVPLAVLHHYLPRNPNDPRVRSALGTPVFLQVTDQAFGARSLRVEAANGKQKKLSLLKELYPMLLRNVGQ